MQVVQSVSCHSSTLWRIRKKILFEGLGLDVDPVVAIIAALMEAPEMRAAVEAVDDHHAAHEDHCDALPQIQDR